MAHMSTGAFPQRASARTTFSVRPMFLTRSATVFILVLVLALSRGGETDEHTKIRLSSVPICCFRHACLRATRPSSVSKTQRNAVSEQRAERVRTLRGGGDAVMSHMRSLVLHRENDIAHRDVVYDTWTQVRLQPY